MRKAILLTNNNIGSDVYEQHAELVDLPDPGENVLAELYRLIGCSLIEFAPTDGSVDIIIDEEGLYGGEPLNMLAMEFWSTVDCYGCISAGNLLMGKVLLVGPSVEGEFTDVPAKALDFFAASLAQYAQDAGDEGSVGVCDVCGKDQHTPGELAVCVDSAVAPPRCPECGEDLIGDGTELYCPACATQSLYADYLAACEAENLEAHPFGMWQIHGEPAGPLG